MKRRFSPVLIILAILAILIVSQSDLAASDEIVAVKERNESWLLSLPGVVGVGIGDCGRQECIKVYIEENTPDPTRQIPQQLEGCLIDVEVTGLIGIVPA